MSVLLCGFPPENPYVQFTHEINVMKGHYKVPNQYYSTLAGHQKGETE